MSYNIDSIEIVKGKLTINKELAQNFNDRHNDDLPEWNFINAILEGDELVIEKEDEDGVHLKRVPWCHQGSGRSFEQFKEALELTKGKADLVLIWEGGDSINGLRISNGKVEEKEVKMTLK